MEGSLGIYRGSTLRIEDKRLSCKGSIMHVCRMEIAKALKKVMGEALENIYYKSETTLPYKADLRQENGPALQPF